MYGGKIMSKRLVVIEVPKEDIEKINKLGASIVRIYKKAQDLRCGENPHQRGNLYKQVFPSVKEPCITNAKIIRRGKGLSHTNVSDANVAIEIVKEFEDPASTIIKHNNPCGIATANYIEKAWQDALATDIYSPFGGIFAFNRPVTESLMEQIDKDKKQYKIWPEIMIAPKYSKSVLKGFEGKENLRVLEVPGLDRQHKRNGIEFKSVEGGFLTQDRDVWFNGKEKWKVVTIQEPSEEDLISMEFAVECIKHVKSNAVLFVKDTRTVAIGGGQTSRVDASWIATHKGKCNIKGSIMASDAFFPLRDAVDLAVKAGVRAIIQPGGSKKGDEKVIEAANEYNIPMVFSGQRYFRH